MKQTAVSWLIEQLEKEYNSFPLLNAEACIQALAMEKEQIIKAHQDGFYSPPFRKSRRGEAEYYYNENFKSK